MKDSLCSKASHTDCNTSNAQNISGCAGGIPASPDHKQQNDLRTSKPRPSLEPLQQPGLLERLAMGAGCMYLSDLHLPSNLPLIRHTLHTIDPPSYPLKEWNDAVCYITGQAIHFTDPKDAAAYLRDGSSHK